MRWPRFGKRGYVGLARSRLRKKVDATAAQRLRPCHLFHRRINKIQMAQVWSATAVDSRREEDAYPRDTQLTSNTEDALGPPQDEFH